MPEFCQRYGETLSNMSTFPFESHNRKIGQMIGGTKSRHKEFARAYLRQVSNNEPK
jgi:hypothetical protein